MHRAPAAAESPRAGLAQAIARALAGGLTLSGWVLFIAGVTLPLVEIRRLRFWSEEPSLVTVIAGLIETDDLFLAIVVLILTIVFPTLKLGYLTLVSIAGPNAAPRVALDHIGWLGRWSMMDVLLLAIGVFAAKTQGLASALSQPGAWCYAGAVVVSAVAAEITKRAIAGRRRPAPSDPHILYDPPPMREPAGVRAAPAGNVTDSSGSQ